ncbi:elongation factor P maturation arginine rhamnosyltransferase EarP [Pseudoalteromonas xiamenensis]|uniref:elongation factor P maturation arginine rhamnosyltransferase EarP n=1 Tax=Pseudoalteromonas xiamenensis TaxID=882626 RepID=UPI0035EFA0D2
MKYTWDIFCDVIDNFGDIGVTWRLAKELAARELGSVRLWVNDFNSFGAMLPELESCTSYEAQGVLIELWPNKFPSNVIPATYVIEAFACNLPSAYVENMPRESKIWLNLEYLSAESWVESCHGMSSGANIVPKYFFFPGFTPKTGGVIVEKDYQSRLNAFEPSTYWQRHDIPAPSSDELRMSVFTYEAQSWQATLQALSMLSRPISLIVPNGRSLNSLLPLITKTTSCYIYKNISLYTIPFSTQEHYDELLWSCDINFVRGEDSFVRAQLAGKPFVWHIYKQDEDAHLDKLNAFLDLAQVPSCVKSYHVAFNRDDLQLETAMSMFDQLPNWHQWSQDWQEKRINCEDLVTQLVKFLNSKV